MTFRLRSMPLSALLNWHCGQKAPSIVWVRTGDLRPMDFLTEKGEIGRDDLKGVSGSRQEPSRKDNRSTKFYPDGFAVSLNDKQWSLKTMSLNPSKCGEQGIGCTMGRNV
jgi:hypothetical protein